MTSKVRLYWNSEEGESPMRGDGIKSQKPEGNASKALGVVSNTFYVGNYIWHFFLCGYVRVFF